MISNVHNYENNVLKEAEARTSIHLNQLRAGKNLQWEFNAPFDRNHIHRVKVGPKFNYCNTKYNANFHNNGNGLLSASELAEIEQEKYDAENQKKREHMISFDARVKQRVRLMASKKREEEKQSFISSQKIALHKSRLREKYHRIPSKNIEGKKKKDSENDLQKSILNNYSSVDEARHFLHSFTRKEEHKQEENNRRKPLLNIDLDLDKNVITEGKGKGKMNMISPRRPTAAQNELKSKVTNISSISSSEKTDEGNGEDYEERKSQSLEKRKRKERRRFQKALRLKFLEEIHLEYKDKVIPTLCTCDESTSAFEHKTKNCANNCVYYGNPDKYEADLLTLVRNLKL